MAPVAYWGSILLISFGAYFVLLKFHQQRPAPPVIELNQAAIYKSASPLDVTLDVKAEIQHLPFVSLPHDWISEEVSGRDVRYYLSLPLNTAPDRLWAIYIPSLEMTPAVFINDVFLGGQRVLEPGQALPRYWIRPVLYRIPNNLLVPGDNRIEVHVRAQGNWGRLSRVYLAPYEDLSDDFSARYFWRVTFLQMTAASALALSFFMLCLAIIRRDTAYSWFAFVAFVWALHNILFLAVELPFSNTHWEILIYLIMALMSYTAAMFTFRYLNEPHPRWEMAMHWVLGLGVITLAAISFGGSHSVVTLVGITSTLAMLLVTGYPFFLMLRHVSRYRSWQTFFLSLCFLFALSTGVHDWWLQARFGDRHDGMFIQFATAPILATFTFILLQRFLFALREADQTTKQLEQRVAEKALEIQSAFEHNRTLEEAQILAQERERIMRDMHDGVGGQIIGMLNLLDRSEPQQAMLAGDMEQALSDLRLMIDSLDDLENDPLVALGLLRNRIQPQFDAAGVHLVWDVADLPPVPEFGPQRVLHFMRILQEAITNCMKHAQASEIRVRTDPQVEVNNVLCAGVIVSDNGNGEFIEQAKGRGIQNMKYRADQAGLQIAWRSRLGSGTEVLLGFPLSTAPRRLPSQSRQH